MENDTIRASGADTLVDVWIDGKMRGIAVTGAAIETYVGSPGGQPAAMSEDSRCEFVRTHLALVMKAAKALLRDDPDLQTLVIGAGQLGSVPARRASERRAGDRRKGERRKTDRPEAIPPTGDRRRGDRRKSERRSRPKSGA